MTRTPRARPPQRVVGAAGADEMQRDGGSPTSALREDELKRVRERERERERERDGEHGCRGGRRRPAQPAGVQCV